LQRRILPAVAPAIPGYHQVLAYRPAFVVTGDYHDFFHRANGSHAVFIGDGSGHGPAASMLMAMMRTILHTHPEIHRDPGETLTAAGRMFNQLLPTDLFMTGVYLLLSDGGHVAWASAGHHPPVLVTRAGQRLPDDFGPVGHVLGFDSPDAYTTITWQLNSGDRLLLFTDGLWDARSHTGEQYGRHRLFEHWTRLLNQPLEQAVAGLVAEVASFLEGTDFEDDFTVVAIERQ
jgi:serine phosphatase RsbU (regulator of sigma subunit)